MNSSGIKRGLATTAVSALAVAGIPFIASSANAAVTDVIQVAFTGPALNADAQGAVVVLKTKGVPDPAALELIASDLSGQTGSQNNGSQTAAIVGTRSIALENSGTDSTPGDGFDEITLRIQATTPNAGSTVSFAVYEDNETANDRVDAAEPRAQVSLTTTGPVASLDVTPGSQTAAAGQPSGDYTVTPRDAGGRATQLTANITLTNTAGSNDNTAGVITPAEAERGSATFKLTGGTPQLYTTQLAGPNATASQVTLDVVPVAGELVASEIDVVTAADSWGDGVGDTIPGTVQVRVDQGSLRIDIASSTPAADGGATVVLNLDGLGNVTFGGKRTAQLTTVLNAQGKGSITVTPDAGTIQESDTFEISGFDPANAADKLTVQFVRSALTQILPDATTYVSRVDGSVDITVTAVDQFGLPVSGAYVDAQRAGQNNDAAPTAKKITDANGKATFTFTDVNAAPNTTDTVTFRVFEDQFDANANDTTPATIRYTADGLGQDFTIQADGNTAGGSAYNPANVTTVPLTDGTINGAADFIDLDIVGGTIGTPVTVSADNGALVLRTAESTLPQGSASDSVVIAGGTTSFQIVGTKTGLTTVTVTSAGRTKTVQFTVVRPNSTADARNVTVSGPDSGNSGEIAVFNAVVTDAFGNGVAGVPVSALNVQVSGPGRLQDSGAVTDATGTVPLNVRLDDDADSTVTVTVTGVPNAAYQFGAAANQQQPGVVVGDAPGITASTNTASATLSDIVNVGDLEQAVEDAEAAVEAAEAALAAAQANLDAAETELAVLQANVDQLQERKADLRQKLNKAKANDNKKKAKTTRKKLRAVKRDLRAAKDGVVVAAAEVDAAQASVDAAQVTLDGAEEDLAEAQAALDEAQN